MAEDLESRRVRAAKNQSLLREVNERIKALMTGSPSSDDEMEEESTVDFACECMQDTCTERITLPIGEYESIRAESNSFIVRRGHDFPDVEAIVRENDGYVIVQKLGAGSKVAERLDPRKRER